MPSLYPKPAREMVLDQINTSNPSLPVPLDEDNTALSAPAVRTTSSADIRNTTLRVIPKYGVGDYKDKRNINYRRLNLSVFFRGNQLIVSKYSDRLPGSAGSLMYTVYELLPDINRLYGLNLTEDDVENANILRSNDVNTSGVYFGSVSLKAKEGSYGYVGSVTLRWTSAPKDLADIVATQDLTGRTFPGGNDFQSGHATILNTLAYGYDWTSMLDEYAPSFTKQAFAKAVISSGSALVPFYQAMVAALNGQFGTSLIFDTGSANSANNLYQMNHECVVLPSTTYPEAMSDYYNRLLVVEARSVNTWAVGRLYIHFNA